MGIDAAIHTSLADALFSQTQQRVLGLLFGQPERSFFTNEVIALAGIGAGSVQRELRRLADSGLVTVSKIGNQKHYQANPASPLFQELCSLARKTFGLADVLKSALRPLEEHISLALLYGSVARRQDRAGSDIDLMVVSDTIMLETLYQMLESAEKTLGRSVSPLLYTHAEFSRRLEEDNPFLRNVLHGETVELIGHKDDVFKSGKSGQDWPAQA
ncbi:transcriptional regulator [Alcanivorax quisquiliarum]|uniref:Transcriptional regulator n=1 Tax=Alcanivorax quisquiliarum TaxID=2933565 RepID=A0ABT0EAC1_9GAMM|nr:transcriptional regulator [Alcanivorax quisquiliarum]MCK0538781.1 transcriptional regulator [Alcanivorax quisquiliarum]